MIRRVREHQLDNSIFKQLSFATARYNQCPRGQCTSSCYGMGILGARGYAIIRHPTHGLRGRLKPTWDSTAASWGQKVGFDDDRRTGIAMIGNCLKRLRMVPFP